MKMSFPEGLTVTVESKTKIAEDVEAGEMLYGPGGARCCVKKVERVTYDENGDETNRETLSETEE